MRAVGLLFCLLGSAVALALAVDRPLPPRTERPKVWVRTVDGWETLGALSAAPRRARPPSLHPFALAGLQCLGSAFVLLAFEREATRQEISESCTNRRAARH